MEKLRTCDNAQLFTGTSKCPIDFGKMVGVIIVAEGTKLPAELTAETLEELVHADGNSRVYGLYKFVEYAKNGGEAQTSTNGYGPEQPNGISARKDTYTMLRFSPELHASLTKTSHIPRGAYFFDENNLLYGINDGSGTLAPFPMATIYSDATPHPTSSAKSSMTVTFAFEDAKEAVEDFDFINLDFKPGRLTLGLNAVKLVKSDDKGGYKIYEKLGKYDLTPIFGPLFAEAGADAFQNKDISAVTYDENSGTLILTDAGEDVKMAAPSVLYTKGIKGIQQVA